MEEKLHEWLKWILKKYDWKYVDWIQLALDGDQLMALWTQALQFCKMLGISWIAKKLLASQEELC
jgi:hypothetical protein